MTYAKIISKIGSEIYPCLKEKGYIKKGNQFRKGDDPRIVFFLGYEGWLSDNGLRCSRVLLNLSILFTGIESLFSRIPKPDSKSVRVENGVYGLEVFRDLDGKMWLIDEDIMVCSNKSDPLLMLELASNMELNYGQESHTRRNYCEVTSC